MREAINFGPIDIAKDVRHTFADHFDGSARLLVSALDTWAAAHRTRFVSSRVMTLLARNLPCSPRSLTRARRALRDAGYLRPETRDGVRGYTLVRHRDVVKQFQCGGEHLCMLDADYEPVQETETPTAADGVSSDAAGVGPQQGRA